MTIHFYDIKRIFLFAIITAFCITMATADITLAQTTAHTGCTAIYNSSTGYAQTSDGPGIECPAGKWPCVPQACHDNPNQANCGPITYCVISGEDAPVSSPLWDEPTQGYTGLGQTILSGKCGPPKAPLWTVDCPASINTSTATTINNTTSNIPNSR